MATTTTITTTATIATTATANTTTTATTATTATTTTATKKGTNGDVALEYLNNSTRDARAITIKQPWASLIIDGIKPCENRSRLPGKDFCHGRWVAIHSSVSGVKKLSDDDLKLIGEEEEKYVDKSKWINGAVLGLVRIEQVVDYDKGRKMFGKWQTGKKSFVVGDIVKFETPLTKGFRGQLGFWRLNADQQFQVLNQLLL
jgi:hypothetical protein